MMMIQNLVTKLQLTCRNFIPYFIYENEYSLFTSTLFYTCMCTQFIYLCMNICQSVAHKMK